MSSSGITLNDGGGSPRRTVTFDTCEREEKEMKPKTESSPDSRHILLEMSGSGVRGPSSSAVEDSPEGIPSPTNSDLPDDPLRSQWSRSVAALGSSLRRRKAHSHRSTSGANDIIVDEDTDKSDVLEEDDDWDGDSDEGEGEDAAGNLEEMIRARRLRSMTAMDAGPTPLKPDSKWHIVRRYLSVIASLSHASRTAKARKHRKQRLIAKKPRCILLPTHWLARVQDMMMLLVLIFV